MQYSRMLLWPDLTQRTVFHAKMQDVDLIDAARHDQCVIGTSTGLGVTQIAQGKPPRSACEYTGCLHRSSSSPGSNGSQHPHYAMCLERCDPPSNLLNAELEGRSDGNSPNADEGAHQACPNSTHTAESALNLKGPLARQSQTSDMVTLAVPGLVHLASLSAQAASYHSVPLTAHSSAQSQGVMTACVANGPQEVKDILNGTGITVQTNAKAINRSCTIPCQALQQLVVQPLIEWTVEQAMDTNSLPVTSPIANTTQSQTRDSAQLSTVVSASKTVSCDEGSNLVAHGSQTPATGRKKVSSAECEDNLANLATVHDSIVLQRGTEATVRTVDQDGATHCSLEVQREHATEESCTSNQHSLGCSSTSVPHAGTAPAVAHSMDGNTNVHAHSGISSGTISSRCLSPANTVEIQAQHVPHKQMVNTVSPRVHDGALRSVGCMTDGAGVHVYQQCIGTSHDSLPGSYIISTAPHLRTLGLDNTAPTPARGTQPHVSRAAKTPGWSSNCIGNGSTLNFGNSHQWCKSLCTHTCVHNTPCNLPSIKYACCAPVCNHQYKHQCGCNFQRQDEKVCDISLLLL